MSDQWRESAAPVEPYFDRTPQPFSDGPPDPLVYDNRSPGTPNRPGKLIAGTAAAKEGGAVISRKK